MRVSKAYRFRFFLWGILGGIIAVSIAWTLWFVHANCGRMNKVPLAEYACEVTFDDYSWTVCKKACDFVCSKPMLGGGRCLGFVKGDMGAHNLDWLVLDEVESLVRVKRNSKRQASLGISSCNPFFKKADIGAHFMVANLLIPAMTVDGINESGVFICVNVVPKGEGHAEISKWNYGQQTTFGTNLEAEETICDILLVRYVLDHATSACRKGDATSAWNLVNQVNWYASNTDFMNEEFHWLIADADTSFVLEFIDNKPVMIPEEKVISNFYAGVNNGRQPHGEGYERYEIVKQNYDSIASMNDMKEVLKLGWFSHLYTGSPADTLHFRYSDLQVARPQGEPDSSFVAYCDSIIADEISVPDRDPECKRWASRHSAVYNMKNRSLEVCFDESGEFMEINL